MKHLPRLAARIFNTPLAIAPDKAAVIAAIFASKLSGATVEASMDDESRDGDIELQVDRGIAQISICGTLVEKSSWLDAMSGMVSYDAIAKQLAVAEADARVNGVLLVIDSPGGEVSGMFECANALAAFTKPVFATVNFCACSAAYLLAAQADQIFITESSLTGSIGVIAQHMERSGWDAAQGIKYTTIYAGARKNDGNPHEPLSEGAQEAIKADVEFVMDQFVAYVAKARGISEDAVRATEAAVFRGQNAIEAGLADVMATPSEALDALLRQVSNAGSVAAATRLRKEVRMASTITADPKLTATTATEEKPEVAKTEKPAPVDEKTTEKKEELPEEEEVLTGAACREISTLCTIAGRPALAAEFITKQFSIAKVREQLLNAAASESAPIHSAIDPSIGANPAAINPNDPKQNPVLADAQRRAAAAKGAR